jgi:hypothetical protein
MSEGQHFEGVSHSMGYYSMYILYGVQQTIFWHTMRWPPPPLLNWAKYVSANM